MSNCCIIVAGGTGLRMGATLPKQFLLLGGVPVLMQTIRKFHNFDSLLNIVLVLPQDELECWYELCKFHNFEIPHKLIAGGSTRFQSVKNGLSLAGGASLIAVHDGVRPLVSDETIYRCFNCATENGTAIPVLPVTESVREGNFNESVPVDRSRYFLVQTPQVFHASIIQEAYRQNFLPDFTDDASVVEYSGINVNLVMGNRENIKITFPEDMHIAELFINAELQKSHQFGTL